MFNEALRVRPFELGVPQALVDQTTQFLSRSQGRKAGYVGHQAFSIAGILGVYSFAYWDALILEVANREKIATVTQPETKVVNFPLFNSQKVLPAFLHATFLEINSYPTSEEEYQKLAKLAACIKGDGAATIKLIEPADIRPWEALPSIPDCPAGQKFAKVWNVDTTDQFGNSTCLVLPDRANQFEVTSITFVELR